MTDLFGFLPAYGPASTALMVSRNAGTVAQQQQRRRRKMTERERREYAELMRQQAYSGPFAGARVPPSSLISALRSSGILTQSPGRGVWARGA